MRSERFSSFILRFKKCADSLRRSTFLRSRPREEIRSPALTCRLDLIGMKRASSFIPRPLEVLKRFTASDWTKSHEFANACMLLALMRAWANLRDPRRPRARLVLWTSSQRHTSAEWRNTSISFDRTNNSYRQVRRFTWSDIGASACTFCFCRRFPFLSLCTDKRYLR